MASAPLIDDELAGLNGYRPPKDGHLVTFTAPYASRRGGWFNRGESAMFSPAEAAFIVRTGRGTDPLSPPMEAPAPAIYVAEETTTRTPRIPDADIVDKIEARRRARRREHATQ